ncbi:AMIN-like domain-containing (lipo)protein [Lentzea sp. HUAS TT2]|uniref:AMIN-like domain-containing (lipo)protein n=1 Tax=Lentzea sp. HUAS TT2 TaxID=3447454 RepID=UPI003F7117C1
MVAASGASTLVAIRAAHHPGHDRVVFEFSGPVPAQRVTGYVPDLAGDPSWLPVPVAADAILQVRMASARGHDDNGNGTYRPTRRTYPLPDVIQIVNSGDFEGVLTFGTSTSSADSSPESRLTPVPSHGR